MSDYTFFGIILYVVSSVTDVPYAGIVIGGLTMFICGMRDIVAAHKEPRGGKS